MEDIRLLLITLRHPISGAIQLDSNQATRLLEWVSAVNAKLQTQDDVLVRLQAHIQSLRARSTQETAD